MKCIPPPKIPPTPSYYLPPIANFPQAALFVKSRRCSFKRSKPFPFFSRCAFFRRLPLDVVILLPHDDFQFLLGPPRRSPPPPLQRLVVNSRETFLMASPFPFCRLQCPYSPLSFEPIPPEIGRPPLLSPHSLTLIRGLCPSPSFSNRTAGCKNFFCHTPLLLLLLAFLNIRVLPPPPKGWR